MSRRLQYIFGIVLKNSSALLAAATRKVLKVERWFGRQSLLSPQLSMAGCTDGYIGPHQGGYICLAECRVVETPCPMLCPMFASLCPLWPHRYHAHITDAELSDRAIPISLWMLIEHKKQESWEGISLSDTSSLKLSLTLSLGMCWVLGGGGLLQAQQYFSPEQCNNETVRWYNPGWYK